MNLMLQIFDNLENKVIILGGDFNVVLDSVLDAEDGSPVLKNLLFLNSLKLKKNTTYVTFRELEIHISTKTSPRFSSKKIRLFFCSKYLARIN